MMKARAPSRCATCPPIVIPYAFCSDSLGRCCSAASAPTAPSLPTTTTPTAPELYLMSIEQRHRCHAQATVAHDDEPLADAMTRTLEIALELQPCRLVMRPD
jgi:hypothetical protein